MASNTIEITEGVAILRLAISLLLGLVIGIEREVHNHPAGIRTFTLLCMGSTLATLASIYICQNNLNLINGDPGRIAAQVLTGVGFIGAGLIIKNANHVSGLTSAASIFMTAAIGIAVGVGMIWSAAFTAIATLILLLSSSLFKQHRIKHNKDNTHNNTK